MKCLKNNIESILFNMARDSLSETDRHCLENSAKSKIDFSNEINNEKKVVYNIKPHTPRVRFVDEESITDRFVSTDEVDHATTKIKKVHIMKNRSSSETSILLRAPSLTKQKLSDRRASSDCMQLKSGENLNNNTLCENLNGKIGGILKPGGESDKTLPTAKTEHNNVDANTKDNDLNNQSFKKNCNVYSVNQAKTIISEKKKSLPLSNIPKLIGHRASENGLRSPTSTEVLCEEGNIASNKDFTARTIGKISRGIGKLLRRSNSVKISEPDPVYKVAYLGNVLTGWARGENCIEKPLATLWRNYNQSTKPDVVMKLSIANSGLKGATKEHGLTEYWSHRITFCASPPHYPKIFCWVYRHEGRKLKHELRCHAVLCSKEPVAQKIKEELQIKLKQALAEFKKDKICKQNARLSLANSVYDNPSMPRRKILLSVGANNYRPPLERSKSAPKLGAIEELCSEEDEEEADLKSHTKLNNELADMTYDEDEVFSTGSLRTKRSKEKVKSPRKHFLSESATKEYYRSVDREKRDEKSFSDEILDLLKNRFDSPDDKLKDSKEDSSIKTSQNDNNTVVIPKKTETPRCALGSIDELNEMGESIPYLVREQKSLEMLGLTTDSDDGSVSSGCETASTATSSDAEPISLPAQLPQEAFSLSKEVGADDTERISVLQRIQSFERGYQPRFTTSISDFRIGSDVEDERTSNMPVSSESAADLMSCYGSCSDDERRPSEEVNHVPIGEKNSFKRRSTYPPLKNIEDVLANYSNQFETLIDNLTDYDILGSNGESDDVFKSSGDNVSACSDESGYSELLENGKESSIANTIMV